MMTKWRHRGRTGDPKTSKKTNDKRDGKRRRTELTEKPDLAREREARFSRITRKSVVEIF
jgi:hypothetical protein